MSDALNTTEDWRKRGYQMRVPPVVIVSYDPAADGSDNDAFVVVTREEHQRGEKFDPDFAVMVAYRIVLAQHMAPGLEFPDKLSRLLTLYRQLKQWEYTGRSIATVFAVESNGIGYAMTTALKTRIPERVLAYTTIGTRGDKAFGENGLIMPRLSALSHMRVLMEQHVLKTAPGAIGMKELQQELGAFVWAAPGRPEAISGQKDDLVMALCGALWIGAKVIPPYLKAEKFTVRGKST